MNNKLIGTILFSTSGMVTAIGAIGSQIAHAIVQSGFYAGKITGEVPPGPEQATPHWIILITIIVLAVMGLYFLFSPDKAE